MNSLNVTIKRPSHYELQNEAQQLLKGKWNQDPKNPEIIEKIITLKVLESGKEALNTEGWRKRKKFYCNNTPNFQNAAHERKLKPKQ